MPYPGNFLRLVMQGSIYNVETWTCSINLFGGGTSGDAPDEVPASVVEACSDWLTDSQISNRCTLELIKLNLIGPDGRYVNQTTVQHDLPAPYPTGGFANTPPAQTSLAITLRTAAQRGPASRGRFYTPLSAAPVDSSGYITTASRVTNLTAAVAFVDALNVALDPWRVAIMSDVGAGFARAVTRVEIGRVMDTIRSRRNKLTEDYSGEDVQGPAEGDTP